MIILQVYTKTKKQIFCLLKKIVYNSNNGLQETDNEMNYV
jgi:hypothetical protein